jgi:hypothetical protein
MRRHIPIGYRMIDGKIVYLNESSTHKIAQKLTAEGFLNANNKPSWNHGSVGRILENTKYLGDTIHVETIVALYKKD